MYYLLMKGKESFKKGKRRSINWASQQYWCHSFWKRGIRGLLLSPYIYLMDLKISLYGFIQTSFILYVWIQLAQQTFKEALGDGIWMKLIDSEAQSDSFRKVLHQPMDASLAARIYKDMQLFHNLEKNGITVELPWDKITTLSNLARLFEQLHKTETASILYRLILFKVIKLHFYIYINFCIFM